MMRMKIQMLAMMFIAALALGACSDDDDKDDVKSARSNVTSIEVQIPLPQSMWNGNRKGAISLQIVKWMGRKRMYGSIIRRNGN